MKRLLISVLFLILLIACSTDSVEKSDYEKLEVQLNKLEEQNQILADAIKYNREYVIELEAEYTFNISENKRKILELEKKISELK
jgi:hypothetical protein|tara:strand:+ start:242 stop:496 length:255 start_codon:yes stop_codon:yes gene_type:complete